MQCKSARTLLLSAQSPPNCTYNVTFDFESAAQLGCFQTIASPSNGMINLSNHAKTVKHGSSSLKWETTDASTLRLSPLTFTIPNNCLKKGAWKSGSTKNRRQDIHCEWNSNILLPLLEVLQQMTLKGSVGFGSSLQNARHKIIVYKAQMLSMRSTLSETELKLFI